MSKTLSMSTETLVPIFGWMSAINLGFFFIGLLKITVFKKFIERLAVALFGHGIDPFVLSAPKIMMQYYILILTFNVVPYLVLRFFV